MKPIIIKEEDRPIIEKTLKEIKKKELKDMSIEELNYIIENDDSLTPSTRLPYITEIFKKSKWK